MLKEKLLAALSEDSDAAQVESRIKELHRQAKEQIRIIDAEIKKLNNELSNIDLKKDEKVESLLAEFDSHEAAKEKIQLDFSSTIVDLYGNYKDRKVVCEKLEALGVTEQGEMAVEDQDNEFSKLKLKIEEKIENLKEQRADFIHFRNSLIGEPSVSEGKTLPKLTI